MCKEMPVIPVKRVVDNKRIIGKMESPEGGERQRVADPKIQSCFSGILSLLLFLGATLAQR
jgi:hypothetical protein